MGIQKSIEKERKLLAIAETAIANSKFDLAWDILDEVFDSFIHVHAWILTESNPEYSIYTKELFKLVEKYELDIICRQCYNLHALKYIQPCKNNF